MAAEVLPSWSDFIAGLDLFLDPIICGAAAGLVLGFLGVYVVLRRMVFLPLAVTHASGLGVVLAFDAQIHLGLGLIADPVLGAFVAGLVATLLLTLDPGHLRLTRESLVGLVYIFCAGAAVLFSVHISQESHEIGAVIFGTAVMVERADLIATLVTGALVLGVQLWWRRGLVFASFDRDGAKVQALPVRLLDTVLTLSIGLMVAVTTRALGAMPVFAFSVLPAMTALSLVRHINRALLAAACIGALTAVAGYVLAFFFSYPVGASQTVIAAVITVIATLARRLAPATHASSV